MPIFITIIVIINTRLASIDNDTMLPPSLTLFLFDSSGFDAKRVLLLLKFQELWFPMETVASVLEPCYAEMLRWAYPRHIPALFVNIRASFVRE